VNPAVKVITYLCTDGQTVVAGYPSQGTAVLTYKDHAYTLTIARSASGARYTGYGLQWWTKGMTHGSLAVLKSGEEIASAPGLDCTAKGAGDEVSPPAPGTPGGLPDDKTPVSEAPFAPTSAQGAANVVQTYYALVEAGKYAEAGKLRSDGNAGDFSPYASYHAQVGAPGESEGAAGSIYIEVPVVVYGRLKTGAELHQSGKAVLRRVNDVPGSTAAQRRWHIERIELTPSS
jgi:membrane-bound inhibitor of C-type lysozyme